MKLPYFQSVNRKNKKQIINFGGLNYGQGASEGELSESLGLSSARFPCLSQRDGRKTAGSYEHASGLYARGKLCVVDGTDFLYDGKVVGQVLEGEKQFATINTKIVIFPDKAFYDTATGEFGSLEAEYIGYPGNVTFTADKITFPEKSYIEQIAEDEGSITDVPASTEIMVYTEVDFNRETGVLTLTTGTEKTADTLTEGDIIQYQCDTEKEYQTVKSVFKDGSSCQLEFFLHEIVLHEYPLIDTFFNPGDAIEISGCSTYPANNGSHIIRSIDKRTLVFDSNNFPETGVEGGNVTVARKVPALICICECDNRIWGAEGTTIYASALGDPKNFYVYDGLSTDSYAAAVGTEGAFTGCVPYSSTVLFWKENYVHKVLGSYPAQYEIYTYTVPGLQLGSEKSLSIINETLFYKGRGGVYAYTGGTPELISENFGTKRFFNAVAGTDGERYYISMQDENEHWGLYVYDTLRGIWLQEDETHAADFAQLDGVLYYLDAATGNVIMAGQDYSEEGRIYWSATLCPFNETIHGRKGYSRLYLRAELEAGSWLKVEISTDGMPYRQVYLTHNARARTLQIPILPTRCDDFKIRLSGKGTCLIKSLVREFTIGSEV